MVPGAGDILPPRLNRPATPGEPRRDRPVRAHPRRRRTSSPTSASDPAPASGTAPRSGPARGSAVTGSSVGTCSSMRASSWATGSRSRTARSIYHGVTVEDGVFIGPGAILTNDRHPRAHHGRRRPRPGRRLDGQPDPPRRSAARSGPGAVVVAGIDVGRVRDGRRRRGRHPRRCRATPSSSATRPAASAGSAPAATRLIDTTATRCPPSPAATPPTCELVCRACGRIYALHPRRRARSSTRSGRARSAGMIPIARPDIGAEEIAAVTEVLQSGMLAAGQAGRRARGRASPRSSASSTRSRSATARVALMCDLRGHRPWAGRRGDHRRPHVHRDRRTRSCRRGPRRSSSTSSRDTYLIDAEPDRGGDHAPHAGDLPGPPVRPAGRHGHDPGHRRPPRPGRRRGCLPGPRRRVPRPDGRQLRARRVQPVRARRT